VDKKTKPTAELLEHTSSENLCRMVGLYRDTTYHDTFLRLLFELPLEVWSRNDLKAEEVLQELKPNEEDALLEMYEKSSDFKQHPLIELILLKKK